MAAWKKTEDGWRLGLRGASVLEESLPRIEVRQGKGTWVVCVLALKSGRARTGTSWSLEEAQRAALAEAREFLDQEYQPLLEQLLAEL